ncbi:MAG: helix-turn-helix domain-containing protein [Clostridiales bacterium]|jgi:transcriptional regulator with XRE-family HTH domain|nr:helix-turn-helix domain-containing protein [Clostridiales bacterium]
MSETAPKDYKVIIAANIARLRRGAGLTQLQLAEKLNYTDKAVSKWERGESVPDVIMLKTIATLFGVSVDALLSEPQSQADESAAQTEKSGFLARARHHKLFIPLLSAALVWLVATITFVVLSISGVNAENGKLLPFLFAVPMSAIVLLVFSSIWGNNLLSSVIVSVLIWSAIAAVAVPCRLYIAANPRIWELFYIGIPLQVLAVLWYLMRVRRKKKRGK